MRRKDLSIKDFDSVLDVIQRCPVLSIAMCDTDHMPYVVPMSFGFEVEGEQLTFYFHGAQAGKKSILLERNPRVFLEGNICHEYVERPDGGISCHYESFMAEGIVERIYGDEASRALDLLTVHCGYSPRPCPKGLLEITAVFRVKAENLTGKRSM